MKIKVVIESGANIHSKHEAIVDFEELEVTEAEWRAMDDTAKHQAVIDYWHSQGYPETWFEEIDQ